MRKTSARQPRPQGSRPGTKPRRGTQPAPLQRGPEPDPDHLWVQEHLLSQGDLLLYGRLAQDLEELPPETFWRDLRSVAERYLAGGSDRTEVFHRLVDATLETLLARDQRFGYPPPFCHKGCSHCCHELVYCTSEEAQLIHRYCQEAGLVIDRAKLARQLEHVATDEHLDHTGATTWNDQEPEDQACAFLDKGDGSCTIWPVRPMVCRVHLAETTDAYCLPHNGQENPNARGINYVETSFILSAVFTIHRNSVKKTMGRLLLELLGG